jgi:hypothetical protein
MAGRPIGSKNKPKPKPRDKSKETSRLARLRRQHERLQDAHTRLVAIGGETTAAKRARAMAEELVWTSLASWLIAQERYSEASQASAAGAKLGELAIKLSKATLAARVHELEQIVARAEDKSAGIRGAARSRKQRLQ